MINHSFAVMAYKDSPFLSECLESLKTQTFQSEVYISTSTPSIFIIEIAKKYDCKVFVSEPGKGIAHDWNFSLAQSKTKYVTLAHQDDLYLPDYAEKCFNAAEKFNDTLICFTKYKETLEENDRADTFMLRIKNLMLRFFMPLKKNLKIVFWKKLLLSTGCPISCPTVMYNRELLHGFKFSNEFAIDLDWDAWYRMTNIKGRFVFVSKVLVKHRIHAGSETSAGLNNNLRQNEDLKMFKRIWPSFIAIIFAKLYAGSYKSNAVK